MDSDKKNCQNLKTVLENSNVVVIVNNRRTSLGWFSYDTPCNNKKFVKQYVRLNTTTYSMTPFLDATNQSINQLLKYF